MTKIPTVAVSHARIDDIEPGRTYWSIAAKWKYRVESIVRIAGESRVEYEVIGGTEDGRKCRTGIGDFARRVRPPVDKPKGMKDSD